MKQEMIAFAESIGAQFALIVRGKSRYTRYYKHGTWDQSRSCLMFWNDDRKRWENSSELSFVNIEKGMEWTNTKYVLIDFINQTRRGNYETVTTASDKP